ncbi:enoyl-CoA hydratase-related protein [Sphingobium baderi]|uniref:Crotonase n=1 Tax=Sphingobium baderi LL03 TaxID=1114964 RepID=T0HP19_9SPHN|nr:enoyl-CoA hydratase-related protein [Sphingobium baderi]EQB01085.1 crotonase [Sphingobium baderi LL03]KMS60949.1 crotonase [Sphingobium baderi LL03]WRD76292.1 enoyl-CoA hydratase-related protein [Sphingobium baderi]
MSDIEFKKDGHTAHVKLNRPQGLNAITQEMDDLLLKAWTEINGDPDIWTVVLSAEGEKAFCIGADVSGGAERKSRMALAGGLTGIGGPLVKLKKPLIAAVQGFCVGGGFELAMCADIIVAADTAQFGLPETKVGIIGECGVVHRAMRQLPHHIAMAMILTGDRIKAEAAERYGLVNEVVPYAELATTAQKWADKVNGASPLANQAAKVAALDRLGYPLEVALMTKFEEIEQYAASADKREGEVAAGERRKPVWTGR